MIRVKICGLTRTEDALLAAEAGADFLGVIFAPSKRQVTLERAQEIVQAVKAKYGTSPLLVGVFVNEEPQVVNQVAEFCGLDYVQLHGDEPWEYCHNIKRPIIRALRLREAREIADVARSLGQLQGKEVLLLLDSYFPGLYGGTGQTFDWELARLAAQHFPFILSGGLTPENVVAAIQRVAPWGVDVASGVERHGEKDPHRIRAFLQAVGSVSCAFGAPSEHNNISSDAPRFSVGYSEPTPGKPGA